MLSYLISHNSDRFDIRPFYYGVTLNAVQGLPLFWERDGMIGKVPAAVVLDLLDVLRSYEAMQQRGRIVDLPAAAYELTWEQTIEHRPTSGEKLTKPLRLDIVPTEGQSGDDTGVPH